MGKTIGLLALNILHPLTDLISIAIFFGKLSVSFPIKKNRF